MAMDIRVGDYVRHSLGQEGKVVRAQRGSVTVIYDDGHAILAGLVSSFTRIDPPDGQPASNGVVYRPSLCRS